MKITNKLKRLSLLFMAVMLVTSYISISHSPQVHAVNTPFTKSFVRYDSLDALTQITGRICFQPTAGTIHTLAVTFPTNSGTDYVVGAAGTWTFNNTNIPGPDAGETALPTAQLTGSSVAVVGKTVTLTFGADLAAVTSNLYCVNWTGATALKTPSVDNPAGGVETVPGQITTTTSAAAVINQSSFSYSLAIISDNSVVVNAVVPPSFSFTLGGNTDTFAANLSTASVNTSPGNTITLTTNANSGWIVWAKDTNFKTVTDTGSSPANEHGALKSATASNYVISNITSNSLGTASHAFIPGATSGNEDYGLAATLTAAGTGAGTTTLNAAYDGTTAGKAGTIDPSQFRPIAADSGTANGAQLTVKELVAITGLTPAAGDYTDTIFYIGAGQF